MTRRLRLRRSDGDIYLDRWGLECRLFGIYLHHIAGPDPGVELHDHPWTFWSFVLSGHYSEIRAESRRINTTNHWNHRYMFSLQPLRLDECHRIVYVSKNTWTIVFRGPRIRLWGFYPHGRWLYWERLPREQRDLSVEENRT